MSDYIALDKIKEKIAEMQSLAIYEDSFETLRDVRTAIEALPAADVRPVVRGEWIVCGDGDAVPYMCSHCGKTVPANLVEIWGANFCPNCGAQMSEAST